MNRLIRLIIKDADNVRDPKVREAYGMLGGVTGIICNLLLFAFKLLAGAVTGAVSIFADAFNNLSDAGSSVVTLIGFRLAGRPADTDHPFGHGRIEYLAGLFVSIAILFMGYELLKSSIGKILHPEEIEFKWISAVILTAAICLKLWMAYFNFVLSRKISSKAMKATAMDSLSDCVSTAAVLGGLLVFRFFNINADGYIGAVVAVLVLYAGYKAVKETIQPLLGMPPDAESVQRIRETVLSASPIILEIHDMVIHDYGPGRRMVSLHAEVPHDVDIIEAHDIIDNIEQRLADEMQYEATIHMDPVITDDEELNDKKRMVESIVKNENDSWMIHDFRMVRGSTHTNLIFDLVVRPDEMCDSKQIASRVKEQIHRAAPDCHAVIKVELSYV